MAAIRAHVFYGCLVNTEWGKPCDPAQVRSARRDALRMRVGWAIVWKRTPFVYGYLRRVRFRYDYGANGVSVYRLNSQPGGTLARAAPRTGLRAPLPSGGADGGGRRAAARP